MKRDDKRADWPKERNEDFIQDREHRDETKEQAVNTAAVAECALNSM